MIDFKEVEVRTKSTSTRTVSERNYSFNDVVTEVLNKILLQSDPRVPARDPIADSIATDQGDQRNYG